MVLYLVAPPGAAHAASYINMGANAMSSLTVLRSAVVLIGNAVEAAVVKRAGAERTTLSILSNAGHCVRPPDPGGTRTRACAAALYAMCV